MRSIIDFDKLAQADGQHTPYSHVLAPAIVDDSARREMRADFPEISRPGFFPLSEMKVEGAFQRLIDDMSSDRFAEILGEKLGIELKDKPRLITVRKWSAAKDGRIHNDGEAKIATALIYLNDDWGASGEGCFRVLNGPNSMDDYTCEAPQIFGTLIAFKRRKVLDDPEMFANYLEIAAGARDVVKGHVEALSGQVAQILRDGMNRREFAVTDPLSAGKAIFEATARFHHPAHAREWTEPDLDSHFEAVWALLLRGLTADSRA